MYDIMLLLLAISAGCAFYLPAKWLADFLVDVVFEVFKR